MKEACSNQIIKTSTIESSQDTLFLAFYTFIIPLSIQLLYTYYGYKINTKNKTTILYGPSNQKNDYKLWGMESSVKRFIYDIKMQFGMDKCAKVTVKIASKDYKNIPLEIHTKITDLK